MLEKVPCLSESRFWKTLRKFEGPINYDLCFGRDIVRFSGLSNGDIVPSFDGR